MTKCTTLTGNYGPQKHEEEKMGRQRAYTDIIEISNLEQAIVKNIESVLEEDKSEHK